MKKSKESKKDQIAGLINVEKLDEQVKKTEKKSSSIDPQMLFNKLKDHLVRGSKSEIKYNASKNDFGE